ncbi:MAG: DUF1329 domain-containing protein [Gammaproteobacteria bacterium]|nr:DUF1329 domain-containing protein [Gammaproteobacteria bacterium]MBI5616104.1 DUF1329 domain-containing protein [Gammaproteobacteria bacterium]
MKKRIHYALLAAFAAAPFATNAFSPEDHIAWVKANEAAKPQFVDGDTITFDKAELVKPFIPAEFQSELVFDGMEMKIKDAGDISPPQAYQDATAKFAGQAKLGADGAIENYTAGRPFDPATFTPGSKEDGFKAIWNFGYRWQYNGLNINEIHWVWVRKGGNHDGHEVMSDRYKDYYKGGGTFERVLTGPYQRVYFSHRADLVDTAYKVPEKFADGTEFREYTGFTSPFDIAGTAFLILRYDDPRKTDDSWAYIPSLRRVRRISVEVKSDSLLGTDHTLEDFYCFSGRPLEHNWEYIGSANVLAVARSRNTDTVYYGPNGMVPLDDWALRLTDVVRQTPKRDNHPYSTKFLYIDRQSGECYYANAFDRGGKLWKVWQLSKAFTDDPQYKAQTGKFKGDVTPEGIRVSSFQSINVIDLQNSRGTLVPCRGDSYPQTKIADVKRVLDVNYLTEGRR